MWSPSQSTGVRWSPCGLHVESVGEGKDLLASELRTMRGLAAYLKFLARGEAAIAAYTSATVVLTLLTRFEKYGMSMILTNDVEVGRPTQYVYFTVPHRV